MTKGHASRRGFVSPVLYPPICVVARFVSPACFCSPVLFVRPFVAVPGICSARLLLTIFVAGLFRPFFVRPLIVRPVCFGCLFSPVPGASRPGRVFVSPVSCSTVFSFAHFVFHPFVLFARCSVSPGLFSPFCFTRCVSPVFVSSGLSRLFCFTRLTCF